MKKIFITGGAGFIGSSLAATYLKEDAHVVIIDNKNDYYDPALKAKNIEDLRALQSGKLEFIEGDIRDAELIHDLFQQYEFDAVVHLAAMAGVRFSIQNPSIYYDVNINGTVNILEAAARTNKPPCIIASSSSVYGGNREVPFSEDHQVDKPISPYAASKKSSEVISHTYHHLYNLDITMLRFFTVYGPRQRPEMAIHLFTEKILRGESLPMFGDGTTSRDYTFIEDIVDGIRSSVEHCNGFNIYNLGNDSPTTLSDLIAAIGNALGTKPKIEQLPLPPGDVFQTWADISKAKAELGYAPKWTIEAGLAKFVEWFNQKGNSSF
jgi:UDP-glucuronate 4-epimerase